MGLELWGMGEAVRLVSGCDVKSRSGKWQFAK